MGNSLKEYRIVLSAELDQSLKATDKFTKDIKSGFIDLQKTVKKTSNSNVKTAKDASKETIAITKEEIKQKKALSKLSINHFHRPYQGFLSIGTPFPRILPVKLIFIIP